MISAPLSVCNSFSLGLSRRHLHFCPLTPSHSSAPATPQMPMIHTYSSEICPPRTRSLSLYCWAINGSGVFLFSAGPDNEALFTPLSAGRQDFNPHYTQLWWPQLEYYTRGHGGGGGRGIGQRNEKRRKTWNSEVSPFPVLLLYPFPLLGRWLRLAGREHWTNGIICRCL